MYGYIPKMDDVVTALDKKVGQIASDAGWQGTAAKAFTSNWEQISSEINAVGLVLYGAVVVSLVVLIAISLGLIRLLRIV